MSGDVTIIGGGNAARDADELLTRAGFPLRHAFELEPGDRNPIILGEAPNAFAVARQAVDQGRHLLVAAPQNFTPERLAYLVQARKKNQAVSIWSERRFHPGYHFVGGLIEADEAWRPRYLRMQTLSMETTTHALADWLTLESIALVIGLAGQAPLSVAANQKQNATRTAPDLLDLTVDFGGIEVFLQVGLGEALERRETLLAGTDRKALVDELNQNTPIRIVEDVPDSSSAARWLSCKAPTPEELARQQVLSFLDATIKQDLAQAEGDVWLRSLAAIEAMERSLVENGIASPVLIREEGQRFRVVPGRGLPTTSPPSVA
ncbi:MAG TPA: hypothetical protein VI759_10180 [Dehalococcoidia bacterium]|nr:hypothetical protein [Dehalococcoidia bacterium]